MTHKLVPISVSIVLVLLFAIASASGQLQAVMKVGQFQGESPPGGYYVGWSDILSFNISVQNSGWSIHGDPLPASLSDMYVTKYVDTASPLLFGAVLTGQRFNDERAIDAQIHVFRIVNQVVIPDVKWLFEDVVVSSYNTVFDGGPAAELIALDYGMVTYEYYQYDEFGNLVSMTSFAYDRRAQVFNWVSSGNLADFELVTQFQSEPSPEPAALVLAGIGLAALVGWRGVRRRVQGAVRLPPRFERG